MRNWKNIFIRLALIAVVICLLPSCGGLSGQKASLPTPTPYPAGIRPLLLAIYHPYPDFSNLPTEVSPLPSYTGWTVHRMERDLARMRDVGFDGVLLAITPKDLANPVTVDAIGQFLALAAAPSPSSPTPTYTPAPIFKVGLLLAPSKPVTLREENVTRYLESKNLLSFAAVLKLDGKPFIGFSEKVVLMPDPYSTCSCRLFGRDWPAMPSGQDGGQSALGKEGVQWVRVAEHGGSSPVDWDEKTTQWPLSRRRGNAFAEGLRQAFALQARIIIVSSWNNYSNGSFMEPNTLDHDEMSKVMRNILNQHGL